MTKPLRKTHWQNVCDTFKQAQRQPTGLIPPWHQAPDAPVPTPCACRAGQVGRLLRPAEGQPQWMGLSGCGGLGEGREDAGPRAAAHRAEVSFVLKLLISLPSLDRTDGPVPRGLPLHSAGLTGLHSEPGEISPLQHGPACSTPGPGGQTELSHIASVLGQLHLERSTACPS